jgi:hypothetical protein
MARQRFIHPDIWSDPTLGKLSPVERLLFIGCFSNADDEGRLLGNAAYLRSTIFPYDDVTIDDVARMRDNITATCRNVVYYVVDDIEYLTFLKWSEYQKPKYAKPSKYPSPEEANDEGGLEQSSLKSASVVESDSPKPSPILGEASPKPSANVEKASVPRLGLDSDRDGLGKDIVAPPGPTPSEDPPEPRFDEGSMPYQLAVHLRAAILARDPATKVPDETPEALQRWATEADRMIRLDSRDQYEAANLMTWCQQDPFWSSNVLSMAAFRKQYDRLKRQSQQPARADPRASPRHMTYLEQELREAGVL